MTYICIIYIVIFAVSFRRDGVGGDCEVMILLLMTDCAINEIEK